MKIAIVKTAGLGDVLRTTMLLPALKRLGGGVEITWITAPDATLMLVHNPYLDRVALVTDLPTAPWRFDKYDWVLSLDESIETAIQAQSLSAVRFTGVYTSGVECLHYTADVSDWFRMGLLRPGSADGLVAANELKRRNTATFGSILYKCLDLPFPVSRPQIFIPSEYLKTARAWISNSRISRCAHIVGLNSGAGPRWQLKKLDEQKSSYLAGELVNQLGTGVILLGGEAEYQRNKRIEETTALPIVTTGPSEWDLLHFSALVSLCDLLITTDSLALHIGIATGVRTISFFGPTSSEEVDVFENGTKIVTDLSCRCCYLATCDKSPNCMDSIAVSELIDKARMSLKQCSSRE